MSFGTYVFGTTIFGTGEIAGSTTMVTIITDKLLAIMKVGWELF